MAGLADVTSRKRQRRAARGPRGKPGKPGRRGARGERGEAGQGAPQHAVESLTAELERVERSLRIQFTRIAQLQAELDSLRASLTHDRPDAGPRRE
jgi:hypothetical protein